MKLSSYLHYTRFTWGPRVLALLLFIVGNLSFTLTAALADELGTNDARYSNMGPNGDTTFAAVSPAVAYNSTNNEYLLVWSGTDSSTGEREIYAQRINAATGAEVGTNDFRISDMGPNGNLSYGAYDPAVAYNPTANEYLVVWWGDDNSGSLVSGEYEIYGQRINGATGAEVGSNDFRISDMGSDGSTASSAMKPAVVYNPSSNEYLVVWQGIDGTTDQEIYAQRLAGSNAAEIGTNDFRISDMGDSSNPVPGARSPSIAYNATQNEYLVVWEGNDGVGGLAPLEYEIYGQRLDASTGAETGTDDFRISDMGPDGDARYNALTPKVAWESRDNRYLVVWGGDDNSGSLVNEEFEIYGQLLSGTTAAEIGANDFRISHMGPDGNSSYVAFEPHVIARSGPGDFVVTWYGSTNTGALVPFEFENYMAHVNFDGSFVGDDDVRLSDMGADGTTNTSATLNALAYDSTDNQLLSVWEGSDNTSPLVPGEYEIFGQRFTVSETVTPSIPDMTPETDTGQSNSDNDTANITPTFTGTAESGSFVTLYSNVDGSVGSVVALDGTYSITVSSLRPGTHLISARSADRDGNWSAASGQLSVIIRWPDTDGDGLNDYDDNDDDDDGIPDAREALDGTDPLDASSHAFHLGTGTAAEWNGYLGMYNIAEYNAKQNLTMSLELYDNSGTASPVGNARFNIDQGREVDYLVHGMNGFRENAYGFLLSFSSGSSDVYDGRMVNYRLSDGKIQFAFAIPFSEGNGGALYVPYNTYQPSLDPADEKNFVANWISVVSLSIFPESGSLNFYAQDGSLIASQQITIPPASRKDVSAHQFGKNSVGLVEWRPDSRHHAFLVRNIRYLYDNAILKESFDSAFQLEAFPGSKQKLSMPLDTRDGSSIIEIANTESTPGTFNVEIYNAVGISKYTATTQLAGHASVHLIVDPILDRELGSAIVSPVGQGKFLATVMQYGRNSTAGIKYLYGIHAQEPVGTSSYGSYNTYLKQSCRLLMVNPTATAVPATFSAKRYDGTQVLSPTTLSVAAHGIVENNICANDAADNFGTVQVDVTPKNTVNSYLIRYGENDIYRFPTPVR
ncbi:MAG: Ig-like domain-containing protein [Bdellovibrionota bacterium]